MIMSMIWAFCRNKKALERKGLLNEVWDRKLTRFEYVGIADVGSGGEYAREHRFGPLSVAGEVSGMDGYLDKR